MQAKENIDCELTKAITVSKKIVACMQMGDFDSARAFDLERADFIRLLSKHKNLDSLMSSLADKFQTLSDLNQSILELSQSLRDDVLTEMCENQSKKVNHQEYLINNKLTSAG